jgi:1-acyl-sn-glycerol-3-phosphate acyltransferase
MAKQELFGVPALGSLIRAVHAFPVNREGTDLGAIRHALHVLKAGGVVGIFPEGRRNIDGTAQARAGAVLLAATAHCPVVPVALVGTNLAAKQLRASRVEVRIGAPVTLQGSARKPTKAELTTWTEELAQRIADLMENNADPKSTDPGVLLRR